MCDNKNRKIKVCEVLGTIAVCDMILSNGTCCSSRSSSPPLLLLLYNSSCLSLYYYKKGTQQHSHSSAMMNAREEDEAKSERGHIKRNRRDNTHITYGHVSGFFLGQTVGDTSILESRCWCHFQFFLRVWRRINEDTQPAPIQPTLSTQRSKA